MFFVFLYFQLTSNQHAAHFTAQKGLRVKPDSFVGGHWDVSFSDLPFQKGTKRAQSFQMEPQWDAPLALLCPAPCPAGHLTRTSSVTPKTRGNPGLAR